MENALSNLTLVINPGSSSVKFGIFQSTEQDLKEICRGSVGVVESESAFWVKSDFPLYRATKTLNRKSISEIDATKEAFNVIATWLGEKFQPAQIDKIAYRIVHGGDYYSAPVQINETVLETLTLLLPLAPLHQPIGIDAIQHFMATYPASKHIACFDTSFHRTMPRVAQTFAIPDYLHQQGIKPYGFHGLSYQYIAERLAEINHNKVPCRTIVAHLGGGSSMCALLNGESVETSMSFSPLDGLPMSTRCGTIDANAVIYLVNQLNFSPDEVSRILNKESGLLGLSGLSGDIRVLINSDSERAGFALDFYVHRICRELGAMMATLKGIDALVFTGGVGENSAVVRKMICEHMDWLGISLNDAANNRHETIISRATGNINVFSIATDEELMMARLVSRQISCETDF